MREIIKKYNKPEQNAPGTSLLRMRTRASESVARDYKWIEIQRIEGWTITDISLLMKSGNEFFTDCILSLWSVDSEDHDASIFEYIFV